VKAGPWDAHFRSFLSPRGIRIVSERAQRLDKPVIAIERPWEKTGISVRTLLFDDGKYRLWAACNDADNAGHWEYFESTDGRTWERPNLGLVEFQGSKDNNLIPGTIGEVFKDPNGSPAERYKTAIEGDAKMDFFEKEWKGKYPYSTMALETDPGRAHAILGAVSPDGLNWTPLPEPLSIEPSDTLIITEFDPVSRKYLLYPRIDMIAPRAEGQPNPTERVHAFVARRSIGRTESAEFRHFPPSDVIVQPDIGWLPTDTIYTNCKTTIPGAPDHHLMFPAIYHQGDDTTSITFYSSYDNKVWQKVPGGNVLDTANFGQYDGGCVFACPNLVELPNGDWALPYAGYQYPHKYPRGAWAFNTSLAIWPKGRLVALEAPGEGEFWTVGFIPPGKTIKINAVTERAGSVRVEVCDFNGQPVAGHTLAEAKPIVGDQFRTPLTWGDATDTGVEQGKPIILHFVMDHAKIYGLDFE
jgi:hypothetical protein